MSHLTAEGAYASSAAGAGADLYSRHHHHGAPQSASRGAAGGHHDLPSSNGAPANNDFARQYASHDFNSNPNASAGQQWAASPYGNAYSSQQNQFATQQQQQPPNGVNQSSHSAYGASPYGNSQAASHQYSQGAGGGAYSGMSLQQQQQYAHHRPAAYMPSAYGAQQQQDSGPPTPNNGLSQQQQQQQQHHASSGLTGASNAAAYHSSGIAGMMPGLSHQGHSAAAPHQSYPSHYSTSLVPGAGGAGAGGAGGMGSAMSSTGYPSAPQYSTQLPLAGRHRVTTTLWEDEGTLCFQVDAKGVCVARRHDNNMINGTKLLNVCGMSRGKRDGILKNEKERIVVKVGAMHLKGVWITFQRGKQLAEQNGIAELLYPLFEPNIQSFLYHPDNYPRTAAVMAAAQERQSRKDGGGSSTANTSIDTDYSSWSNHPIQPRHSNGSYLSAPSTAAQSPVHSHSGYGTPGGMGNGSLSAVQQARSASGIDRRQSNPLADHRGDPYGSIDGLSSHNSASALQSLAAGNVNAGRRMPSGGKRGFDDGTDSGDVGYGLNNGSSGIGSNERSFKRSKDDGLSGPDSYESGLGGGDSSAAVRYAAANGHADRKM